MSMLPPVQRFGLAERNSAAESGGPRAEGGPVNALRRTGPARIAHFRKWTCLHLALIPMTARRTKIVACFGAPPSAQP